jgi:hypothetical protein
MMTVTEPSDSLEVRARDARSRLFHTLDVLDQRKRELAKVGQRARSMLVPLGLAAAGLLVMGTTAALVAQRRIIRRAKTDWRRLVMQRVLPEPVPSGFLVEASRRAGIALVLLGVNELAKRVLRSL